MKIEIVVGKMGRTAGVRGVARRGSYESYDNGLTRSRSFGPRGLLASPRLLSPPLISIKGKGTGVGSRGVHKICNVKFWNPEELHNSNTYLMEMDSSGQPSKFQVPKLETPPCPFEDEDEKEDECCKKWGVKRNFAESMGCEIVLTHRAGGLCSGALFFEGSAMDGAETVSASLRSHSATSRAGVPALRTKGFVYGEVDYSRPECSRETSVSARRL
jgi:hypothetical protein